VKGWCRCHVQRNALFPGKTQQFGAGSLLQQFTHLVAEDKRLVLKQEKEGINPKRGKK
jgi:hypothetical protein